MDVLLSEAKASSELTSRLVIASTACGWGRTELEQLLAGRLPARSLDHETTRAVAVMLDECPHVRPRLVAVMRHFAANQLQRILAAVDDDDM